MRRQLYNIGYFIVTWIGTSWIKAQLTPPNPNTTYIYSWARTINDTISSSEWYRQPTPYLGDSYWARRLALGLALGQERLFLGMTKRIVAAMKRDQIHLLHAQFGRAGYYALPMLKHHPVPLITSFYGYDVSEYPAKYPIWRKHYSTLFDKLNYALCLGKVMQSNVIELGCPPEKALIHHLGVAVEQIQYVPRLWHKGTPLRILIASAFRERKGIPYALEALGTFKNDYPIELTIIGDAPDHPDGPVEKQKILTAIETCGLQTVTTLRGNQPYHVLLEEAYKHHIFMGPSITASDGDMEGTPMVLVDMAATGMPLISTTHSDIPEIIQHARTGFLAAERDSAGLLEHLYWYAEHPEQWERITWAGREHIEREFDQAKQNQKLQSLYTTLIESRL
jgi:colanic acid/amylovoran biosynthesis glycosyltransferase